MTHSERLERARGLLLPEGEEGIPGARVRPSFSPAMTPGFTYRTVTRDGVAHRRVDANGTVTAAFDHAAVAAALGRAAAAESEPPLLHLSDVVIEADGALAIVADGVRWRLEPIGEEYRASRMPDEGPEGARSPDGKWTACVHDGDLILVTAERGELRLTADAQPGVAYASPCATGRPPLSARLRGVADPVLAVWSPDGRFLLTHRIDERDVPNATLIEAAPADGGRPRAHTAPYAMPGDALPAVTLVCFDMQLGSRVAIDADLAAEYVTPLQLGRVWWSADSSRIWFVRSERGSRSEVLAHADPRSGHVTEICVEDGHPYADVNPLFGAPPIFAELGEEVLWFSERDGWGHLYVLDAASGTVRRRLTSGEWLVRELVEVDRCGGFVYFTAGGREPGRSPYHRHLYRVPLAGGEIELLTPEDADHEITPVPGGRRFLDTYGCTDAPAVTLLRANDGTLLGELERVDVEWLRAKGWRAPAAFTVRSADGSETLHGLLYAPPDLDARGCAIVDSIYPGPHRPRLLRGVGEGASFDPYLLDMAGGAPALAQLGFAVILLDGRGTALRSRAFRAVAAGRLELTLDDHAAAIRQLAATHTWLDPRRTAIVGHSAGGFAAARALARHPETFSVAVSSCGNHDLAAYHAAWGEKYEALPLSDGTTPSWSRELAACIQGDLLLIAGELDDNAHPALTLRVVDALVRADKDFELLILPGVGHDEAPTHPYALRRTWEFLLRALR